MVVVTMCKGPLVVVITSYKGPWMVVITLGNGPSMVVVTSYQGPMMVGSYVVYTTLYGDGCRLLVERALTT